MVKKKNLSHACANRKDVGLFITRTHPYLQTIKALQWCRLFLKQCDVVHVHVFIKFASKRLFQ